MWRNKPKVGPSLPQHLLTELGSTPSGAAGGGARSGGSTGAATRKARRKQERAEKGARRLAHAAPARPPAAPVAAAPAQPRAPAATPPVPSKRRAVAPPEAGGAGVPGRGAKRAKTGAVRSAGRVEPPLSQEQRRLREEIEAELRLQRSLSRKLKGRTKGPADGLNALFEGLSQPAPLSDEEEEAEEEEEEEEAVAVRAEPAAAGRYVPPGARGAAGGDDALARRVRGLLNRLGVENCVAVTAEAAALCDAGHTRHAVTAALVAELLAALERGPRCSGATSAALATLASGVAAASLGPAMGARLLAGLASALDTARAAEDSRAAANLGGMLARLCLAGLVQPSLVAACLRHCTSPGASPALPDGDVALTLNILRICGPKLRAEDPEALRDFVAALQARAAAAQAAAGADGLSTRARLLLGLVCDLKNGLKGKKAEATGGDEAPFPSQLLRAARDAGVAGPAAALAGLTWERLLDPAAHIGAWWLPGPAGGHAEDTTPAPARAPAAREADDALLTAAAALRMNTGARRAAFVALMGAADAADAAERLLRLPLAGSQEREIVRVLLECCLGEAAYNPFYEAVAARLGAGAKRHRVSLQYAVWDRWGPPLEAAPPRALAHLARFAAGALLRGALPLSALRGAELGAATAPGTHPNRVAHFRLLLLALLRPPPSGARTLAHTHALLKRAAGKPALAALRLQLLAFLKVHVLPLGADEGAEAAAVRAAVAVAEAALAGEGMPQAGLP